MVNILNTAHFVSSWTMPGILNLETGMREALPAATFDTAFLPPDAPHPRYHAARLALLCADSHPPRHQWRDPSGLPVGPSDRTRRKIETMQKADLKEADARILATYNAQLRGREIQGFEKYVLPMARKVLGHTPAFYEEVLCRLITVAEMWTPAEMQRVWEKEVTRETFAFQKRFDALTRPDSRLFDRFLFAAVPLDRGLKGGELASLHGLQLLQANVDLLTRALVGTIMLQEGDRPERFSEMLAEDGRFLPNHWRILVVERFDDGRREIKGVVTAYNNHPSARQGQCAVYMPPDKKIIDAVLRIPFTFLMDGEQRKWTEVGRRLFIARRGAIVFRHILPKEYSTVYPGIHLLAKQWELAVKLALQNFLQSYLGGRY